MTKAEIISQITDQTGLQRKEVAVVVESFMECVRRSMLDRKENVYLRGFGTFYIKHCAAKTARNIGKNVAVRIKAHDVPGFKPSKAFSGAMSGHDFVEE